MKKIYLAVRRAWHVIAKTFAFFCFGLGSLVLALLCIPVLRLVCHPRERFQRAVRRVIHRSFALFVLLMKVLRLISVRIENHEALRSARSCLICANHPSLIDVVILIGLVRQADCVVKSKLWSNVFMRHIVRSIYIPNSLDAETTIRACGETLAAGNNLVIFPEGTRTESGGEIRLQRNAAQVALRTGNPILPVQILADCPRGLQKGDSLFVSPPAGIVRYVIRVKTALNPDDFASLSLPQAARMLTKAMKEAILDSGNFPNRREC